MQCQNNDVISRQREVLRWHDVNTTRPTRSNVFQRLWQNLWFNLVAWDIWSIGHADLWKRISLWHLSHLIFTETDPNFWVRRSSFQVRWIQVGSKLDPRGCNDESTQDLPVRQVIHFQLLGIQAAWLRSDSGPTPVVMVKPLASARSNIDTYIIIYWHYDETSDEMMKWLRRMITCKMNEVTEVEIPMFFFRRFGCKVRWGKAQLLAQLLA